ncbi:MAG TPA: hypothetical protein DCS97_16595 [Planctomycetes bacterium]|nr:hypothetical protein [Planctomycetota bacterium]
MRLKKANPATSAWAPLESGVIHAPAGATRIVAADGAGRIYLDAAPRRGQVRFQARGAGGIHRILAITAAGATIAELQFRLQPRTQVGCDAGIYADYHARVGHNMMEFEEGQHFRVGGRMHNLCVGWLRDHTYTLKALRHFWQDVTSGTELFLQRQQPSGMIWDDIHANRSRSPSWFGEALGKGYFDYADDKKWIFRRIPVEADVEYIVVESVHHAWKASGDDAWMQAQLPRLEKAIAYSTSHPLRWSKKHGLVKRAYTMDSWDFKHPAKHIGGGGDHRILNGPDQPFFLFHGDNSGIYAAYWRMAEMYRCLGDTASSERHERLARELRARANTLLWKAPIYAHMVPEKPMPRLKAEVGDDDKRISLSLPYTVNRGLPDHRQAVRIIDEYRRRGRAQRATSFAEWWAMDPMYLGEQWHDGHAAHQTPGEYMNGSVSPLVAGELARAAFEHGREEYGADILRRLWTLSEADDGHIHDCYRRLPPGFKEPGMDQKQSPLDLRMHANVGLRHRATPGVPAWTDEGDNDLRGLPTGRQRLFEVDLEVLDPDSNAGKSAIALGGRQPSQLTIPIARRLGSFYVVHALGGGGAGTIGAYVLIYADGSEHRHALIAGRQVANWWNPQTLHDHRSPYDIGRICWRGPNPSTRDVGVYLSGFTNPHPQRVVSAIRLEAASGIRLMVCALTTADGAARLPRGIRSHGLPSVWSQASIHHAIVEGLGGIEDTDRAFRKARVSPRWSATEASQAEVCVHYPSSGGYCAYRWSHDAKRRRVEVDVTGSFSTAELRILMPAGTKPATVQVDGQELTFRLRRVERSAYALIQLDHLPRSSVVVGY